MKTVLWREYKNGKSSTVGRLSMFSLVKTEQKYSFNTLVISLLSLIVALFTFKGPTGVLSLVLVLIYALKGFLFPLFAILF